MKYIYLALVFVFTSSVVYGQYERGVKKINLWYNYAMPMGDFKNNYIGESSTRAASVELLWHLNPQLQLGLGGGVVNFYEKFPRQTFKLADGSDISAVMANNVQSVPVLATVVYSPLNNVEEIPLLSPFLQFGAGIAMNQFQRYLGEFTNENLRKTQFAAKAGAGVKFSFGRYKQHGVLAGAHYNFTGFELPQAKNLQYITGGIGLQFAIAD